jgi:hypothetical protein
VDYTKETLRLMADVCSRSGDSDSAALLTALRAFAALFDATQAVGADSAARAGGTLVCCALVDAQFEMGAGGGSGTTREHCDGLHALQWLSGHRDARVSQLASRLLHAAVPLVWSK